MNFRAWFKSRTADRVLSPLRAAISAHIDDNSDVLEVGCGTGDLLFRTATRLKSGVGVDLDQQMIDFAISRKAAEQHHNLEFINGDITSATALSQRKFDVATSTLCLHEMPEKDAIDTLKLFRLIAAKLVIADYAPPKTFWGKVSIELDELISGHYRRFTRYRSKGGLPNLASAAGLEDGDEIDSPIDGIRIWVYKAG